MPLDMLPNKLNASGIRVREAVHGVRRTVRGLSVVDIVPLDVLLEVLGGDARPVAERLHRLLLPSYFGVVEEGPACVAALLRQHPEVGSCPASVA